MESLTLTIEKIVELINNQKEQIWFIH
jgi:hypothetical protein